MLPKIFKVELSSNYEHSSYPFNKSDMNKHFESIHEGKKPFRCEICDYSCSQEGAMHIYVASVHEGKKPFKCEICDYYFHVKVT